MDLMLNIKDTSQVWHLTKYGILFYNMSKACICVNGHSFPLSYITDERHASVHNCFSPSFHNFFKDNYLGSNSMRHFDMHKSCE